MKFADLLLFDIDGTLVRRAGPHHRMALVEAVHHVMGIATTTDGIPIHGMLDTDIVTQMLLRIGFEDGKIAASLPAIVAVAEEVYVGSCPDIRRARCPEVEPLLQNLTAQGIPLALVTGNFSRIGWKKLERAGLHHYFEFGAFAEMAPTRGGLVKLAIQHAKTRGLIGANARIAHVGDAPQDILAAQENGIPVIAVKTGVSSGDDLEELEPDHLIEDFRHWPNRL